jgi:hypothetical protein
MKYLCLICAERPHMMEYRTPAGAQIGCVEVRPVAQDTETARLLGHAAVQA